MSFPGATAPEDIVREWEAALTTGRRSNLRLGELAYQLERTGDLEYASIAAALQERGHSAPEKGHVSKCKRSWYYWHFNLQYPVDELATVGISKLYLLATHIEENGGDPDALLEKARNMSRADLQAHLTGGEAVEPDEFPWTQEKAIRDAFTRAAKHLYATVGHEARSLTPAIEFATVLLAELPAQTLRNLWAEAHGEAKQ